MKMSMTLSANRNNRKVMLGLITFIVMVVLCLGLTVLALQFAWRSQHSNSDSFCHGGMSLCTFWMVTPVMKTSPLADDFTLLTLMISLETSFGFFCSAVTSECPLMRCSAFHAALISLNAAPPLFCFRIPFYLFQAAELANFAPAISVCFFGIKLIQGFDCLTESATFCYYMLRHGFLLRRKSCLEPVAERTVIGSVYYMQQKKR